MEASNEIKSTANILVHVIILFSFLSIFFFMYISRVESEAFKNELGDMIRDRLNDILTENPDITLGLVELKPYIERFIVKYSTESKESMQRNIMLKFLAVFTVLIILGIILTIVITVSIECKEKIHIGEIIVENIIIFTFIGMVEYMFFTRVASKYIPVMPSLMINTILDTIKAEIKPEN